MNKTKHPIQDSLINLMLIVSIVITSLMIMFYGGYILWFVIANFILILFILDKISHMENKAK